MPRARYPSGGGAWARACNDDEAAEETVSLPAPPPAPSGTLPHRPAPYRDAYPRSSPWPKTETRNAMTAGLLTVAGPRFELGTPRFTVVASDGPKDAAPRRRSPRVGPTHVVRINNSPPTSVTECAAVGAMRTRTHLGSVPQSLPQSLGPPPESSNRFRPTFANMACGQWGAATPF